MADSIAIVAAAIVLFSQIPSQALPQTKQTNTQIKKRGVVEFVAPRLFVHREKGAGGGETSLTVEHSPS